MRIGWSFVARVAGKVRLDLTIDPLPDLALEVDVTSGTPLAAYAALGVPELWRYRDGRLEIWRLGAQGIRARLGEWVAAGAGDRRAALGVASGSGGTADERDSTTVSALVGGALGSELAESLASKPWFLWELIECQLCTGARAARD